MRNLWLFIFLLLVLPAAAAQPSEGPAISGRNYFFMNYSTEQGLSDESVNCITKDADGFLWIGTEAGLNRFNGYDFTVYKSLAGDTTTISANTIRYVYSDRSGILWICTGLGICRYEKRLNRFTRLRLVAGTQRIFSSESFMMVEDRRGVLWAGTDHGLMRYNPLKDIFELVPLHWPQGVQHAVKSMTEEKDGTLWLLNYQALLNFDPLNGECREFPNRLPGGTSFQGMVVAADPSETNCLWIGSWGHGVIHFQKSTGKFDAYHFHPGGLVNLDNIIFDISTHEPGKLWLSSNSGVLIFDKEKKQFEGVLHDFISDKPVVNIEAKCIYKDKEGVAWIGTVGGLCNVHPARQKFVGHSVWPGVPPGDFCGDIKGDKIYSVKLYSDRSLSIFDVHTGIIRTLPIPQADELHAEPFCILQNDKGVWIGTSRGIYCFNEKAQSWSLLKIADRLGVPDRSLYVQDAIDDKQGNVWFSCTSRGLLKMNLQTGLLTPFFYDDKQAGFPLISVVSMSVGKDGCLYACDDRRGVVKLNIADGTWKWYSTNDKKYACLFDATSIASGKDGCAWITTRNNGLVCIDSGGTATSWTRDASGNIIDELSDAAVDNSGDVWFSAATGIFRFRSGTKTFTGFTMLDGLPSRSVPLRHMANGDLAIRTIRSIFLFDPLRIDHEDSKPAVHLVSMHINGQPLPGGSTVDWSDTMKLDHTQNNLSFEFAATEFARPNSTAYRYMLRGADRTWSSPTASRTVNFSGLTPGDYELWLKAGEGPVKRLALIIVPAWWQTRWFRWFTMLLSAAAIVFLVRLFYSMRYRQRIARLEQQREIESIRSRISRDIHDEIGAGLTKIKLMSRSLSRGQEPAAAKDTSGRISAASDDLIRNLGQIVWTINPANDSFINIVAFVRSYVPAFVDEHGGLSLSLELPEPSKIPQDLLFDPEKKHNLLLILKECITNVVKHAQATEVRVSLAMEKDFIELRVSDNGIGIREVNSNGNGLRNMAKRAEAIRAEFRQSSDQQGTHTILRIPILRQ